MARFVLCTLIFDLCVCLTAAVEWYKAPVDPGSQPATLKIIFFFFLFLSIYLSFLSCFRYFACYSVPFFFGKRPSQPQTVSLHGRHLGFLRSIV